MSIGTLLVIQTCFAKKQLTKKFKALMDSTPKFASCSSCKDAGFGTFGQHWQKKWEIANFLTFTQTIFQISVLSAVALLAAILCYLVATQHILRCQMIAQCTFVQL